jgi:hypothetical protein
MSRLLLTRFALAAMVATLASTGCTSRYTPVLSDHALMPGYSADEVRRLTGHAVKVEVYGNPFIVPPHAFDGQVASNMNQSAAAPAHFVADPEGNAIADYRVVWNFSPPQGSIAPNAICQGKYVKTLKPGMPIDAYAAFCRNREALSSVRGRLYYTDTPNSVEFLTLVDAMTTQLFPRDATGLRRPGDARLGDPLTHRY